MKDIYQPPRPSVRMFRLTLRNYMVWRKLILPSISMNIAEPLIFLFGFGIGVGALIDNATGGEGGYLQFIAAGMVCYGAMFSASFEALYSAFTRMHVQKTWQGILNTPMTLDDVLLGEWLWATAKGTIAATVMLMVVAVLGYVALAAIPLIIAVAFVTTLAFAGIGLAVNAIASSYDFFSYYFTLFLTPMMMVSGVFFPVTLLPAPVQVLSAFLPLTHTVSLVRPLMLGETPAHWLLHLLVLLAFALVGVYIAAVLTRKRLLK